MLRRALALVLLGCSSASQAAAPAVPPPVCAPSPMNAVFTDPVELAVTVIDDSAPSSTCQAPSMLQIRIDEKPWCQVSIPCATAIQAPSPSFRCDGPKIAPGEHELGMQIGTDPVLSRRMSLPAFDVLPGGIVVGAFVRVRFAHGPLEIEPPTASRQMGL